MKTLLLATAIPFVLVAGVAGYVLRSATDSERPVQRAEPEPGVAITVVSIQETKPSYSIDVRYPQAGLAFDSAIRNVANERVDSLRNLAAENRPQTGANGALSLRGDCESIYIGHDITSVRMVFYEYGGGAHGSSRTYGFNFDRASGKPLTLDDALALIGLDLPTVSDAALSQLRTRLGPSLIFPEGAAPKPENFQTFVVTLDSVTFIFGEYQVAPYAAGAQEVSFARMPSN